MRKDAEAVSLLVVDDKSFFPYNCNINYYKFNPRFMRNIINISLPEDMVKSIQKEMKKEHFSTKSEFFRMLVRLWMEGKLTSELEESREELRQGKGTLLTSLKRFR